MRATTIVATTHAAAVSALGLTCSPITAESDVPDGNPGNNASTALVQVRTEVNLRVEKLVFEFWPQ